MQMRFKQGLADNSGMLGARMAVFQQHDMDLQLQTQTLLTDVALTKALGGGYRVEKPTRRPHHDASAAVPQSK